MSEELICPHCGAAQETHEPDQISANMCWTQCEKCGKAKAEADAQVTITNAKAEAEENRLKSESITDELIRMTEAEARKEHGWVTVQGADAVVADEGE